MLTMITTFGLKMNKHSLGLVEQVLGLKDLFGWVFLSLWIWQSQTSCCGCYEWIENY